jgi:hypothetical protein
MEAPRALTSGFHFDLKENAPKGVFLLLLTQTPAHRFYVTIKKTYF